MLPPALGEPVFDKLEADLAKAMLSLPATKGFEIGSGFAATRDEGLGAQRSVRDAGGKDSNDHQSFRRSSGRHQQRRRHCLSRRVQADRDDFARTKNSDRVTVKKPRSPRKVVTIPAFCRARSRWSKR